MDGDEDKDEGVCFDCRRGVKQRRTAERVEVSGLVDLTFGD